MSSITTRAAADQRAKAAKTPHDPLGADPLAVADKLAEPAQDEDPILRKESGESAFGGQIAFNAGASSGGGDMPYKKDMEGAFSADFSSVTAFTGQKGPADAMGAVAATQGEKMVFADSTPDKETVAHEAAHVVQSRNGQSFSASGPFGAPGSAAETEADSAASAVASGGSAQISGKVDAPIHRRKKPGTIGTGAEVEIPPIVDSEAFKGKVSGLTKGDNITAIINWLKAIDKYTTNEQEAPFHNAVRQCKDAVAHWLNAHPDPDAEGGSVKKNAPVVRELRTALARLDNAIMRTGGLLGGGLVQAPDDKVEVTTAYDVAESVSGVGPTSIEKIGQGVDMHGEKSHYGDTAGPKVEMMEGTFAMGASVSEVVLGGKKIKDGMKGLKSGSPEDQAKAKKDLATGSLDVTSGVALGGQGIGKAISASEKLAHGTDAGKGAGNVSDGFGGVASSLGVISEGVDLYESLKKGPETAETEDEAFHRYTNMTQNVVGMARGTADAINNFTKAATGAASAGAATTSGALGVVTGSIDMLEAGYEAKTALASKANMEKVRNQLKDTRDTLSRHTDRLRIQLVFSRTQATKDGYQTQIDTVNAKIAELGALEIEMNTAFEAMDKVQSRRLKKAAFKGVTGTMDVVGGILVLSGVGAPVAISLAAFSALLKLGNVGLQFGRAMKASKLTEIALRLGDDGSVKGKPDDAKDVSYRTMEQRVYATYYKNYAMSADDKPYPDGLNSTSWGHIRDFVHEDKLSGVPKEQSVTMKQSQANGTSKGAAHGKWATFTKDDGTTTVAEEYPSMKRRAGLTFTFSAHQSAQAIDASNAELADAVYSIAMGAFDPNAKAFVSTEVTPTGTREESDKGAIKKAMATTLLASVGIKDAQWQEMWNHAGGHFKGDQDKSQTPPVPYASSTAPDPDKLKALVKKKVDAT